LKENTVFFGVKMVFNQQKALAVKEQKIDTNEPDAAKKITEAFSRFFCSVLGNNDSIILLCIGTDRSTGDCLGPLVGTKLIQAGIPCITVMGNLEEPVHAKNLKCVLKKIDNKYSNPLIIAVDACLGKLDHVGYVTIGLGPLKPGAGVKKDLPPVGKIYLTGIVNIGGFMEYLVLQNTRLSRVMKMADTMAQALIDFFKNFKGPVSK
jgi:putative sporulation protein YyaC